MGVSHFDTSDDSAYVCKHCGSSLIRTIERGWSHADAVVSLGDDGKPEVSDFCDGVDSDADWETVGYYCRDCEAGINGEITELSDLVTPRASFVVSA